VSRPQTSTESRRPFAHTALGIEPQGTEAEADIDMTGALQSARPAIDQGFTRTPARQVLHLSLQAVVRA
jgi:hypothetical protein